MAAVIDDVLGLIVLAVVAGIIGAADQGAAFQPLSVVWIIAKAVLFLTGALVLGRWVSQRVFQVASGFPPGDGGLDRDRVLLRIRYLAALAGLAPIVGAFAAGLVSRRPIIASCARATLVSAISRTCWSRSPRFWCRSSSS